ncbi:MAG: outer membrane beta-barrel protein [Candidatus Cyclobacteriaceae bacterium M3_2C_046]
MNKTLLIGLAFYFLSLISLSAQPKTRSNSIGVNFSAIANDIIILGSHPEGSGTLQGKGGWNAGFNYIRQLDAKLSFETGFYLAHHQFIHTSAYFPRENRQQTEFSLNMVSMPVNLLYNFGRSFIVKGGMFITQTVGEDNNFLHEPSGLGLNLGLGKEITLSNALLLIINPELKLHTLLPFDGEKHQQRITEAAIKFDLHYRF